jgi:hypothetical protein
MPELHRFSAAAFVLVWTGHKVAIRRTRSLSDRTYGNFLKPAAQVLETVNESGRR